MRRRRAATLRARLTVLATVFVGLVLLVSAFALVAVQQNLLLRGVDEALVQRADNVQSGVGAAGAVLPGEGDREDSFLQLLDARGAVVASSDNVKGLPAATGPTGTGFRTVPLTGLSSHDYRLLSRRVGAKTLLVGKNVDDVGESVSILEKSLAVAIPIVLLILAAAIWWLTGRALGPVEEIRAEVAGISGSELHRRVPVHDRADEISHLARTMNAMLERVQRASERQRQFVADASHELRSPLTRIRSALEVNLAHPSQVAPERAYRELLADTRQLQQLVDDLLLLARSESGVLPRAQEPVDLDDLVLAEAARVRERGLVRVDVRGVSAGRVAGDPHLLTRAIANLTSNAERYASSTVMFALHESGGETVLVVADDGPGIPAADRQAVFERFTRLDAARAREAGGVGLGLAIVADIVERHRGRIAISDAAPTGARFVVTLPTTE